MRVIIFVPKFPEPPGFVITESATYITSNALMVHFEFLRQKQLLLTETGDTDVYECDLTHEDILKIIEKAQGYH